MYTEVSKAYDLRTEPFVPVVWDNGTPGDVGLHETLTSAHRIRAIAHPSPLVTFSLHRLLIAILYRAVGPWSPSDWAGLWRRGAWDRAALDGYLDRWSDRFDLFHPTRPFYQVPDLPNAVVHPVQHLMFEAASGNNASLFDHHMDDVAEELPAAEAARHLVAYQAYAIGFGKSDPFYFSDGPLTRGLTVLVEGATLFQTLLLNMRPSAPEADDGAPWEDVPARPLDPDGTPVRGTVDYLTWQSRRIRLVPASDSHERVLQCQILQGYKLPKTGLAMDPAKAYRVRERVGLQPVGLSADRVVWRDGDVLFARIGTEHKAPLVFAWLADARDRLDIDLAQRQRFSVFGLATDPGKAASVLLWRHEGLPLPLNVLENDAAYGALVSALGAAEDGARALSAALWRACGLIIAPGSDDEDGRRARPEDVRPLVEHTGAGRRYWAMLNEPFRAWLVDLPTDGEATLAAWAERVQRAAEAAYDGAMGGMGDSARAIKATVQGRTVLARHLRILGGAKSA